MLREYGESIGLRSTARHAGNRAQHASLPPRLTLQSIQEMLQKETGEAPSALLAKIISTNSCRSDHELQALETFGDRVLDLCIRYEITRICPNLSSSIIEGVVKKRTNNVALARYAERVGLGELTGDTDKALADRLEMLAGIVFLHGGVKTLRTLLSWDAQRPLIPTKEDLTLAHYMSVAGLPPAHEYRIGEFGLTAHAIGGINYRNQYWLKERNCCLSKDRLRERVDALGRSVIETVLLAFAREREPYRTPKLLTTVRDLIYRSRRLHPADVRHGLTVMFQGKRVSVFSSHFTRHVGNEALHCGALQSCRNYLGDNGLRSSMHALMDKHLPVQTTVSTSVPASLERLNVPKKDAFDGDSHRNYRERGAHKSTQGIKRRRWCQTHGGNGSRPEQKSAPPQYSRPFSKSLMA